TDSKALAMAATPRITFESDINSYRRQPLLELGEMLRRVLSSTIHRQPTNPTQPLASCSQS
uniref:LysR family transcriptional regulator n=1 Tax=Panagrellus redivivus TaxID=6233 RepID=A0A7E4W8H3_PANRE